MAQDDSSGSGNDASKPVDPPQISKTALPGPTLPRPPSTSSSPVAAAVPPRPAAPWLPATDTTTTSSQLPSIEATSLSAASTPTLVSTGEVGSVVTAPSAPVPIATAVVPVTAPAVAAGGPFPHQQQNGSRASPSLPSPSMSHSQQPQGPPRQPNVYPAQTPYPQAMAGGPYAYTTSSQPSDAYRTTTGPDPGHHLPSMRTLDAVPSQHGMAPQGPPTMGMGMGMPGPPHGMQYYNPSAMAMGGQYIQTDMMRYPLPPHDPRFQMGRGPKKEIKRRTKTGCMTCRKRRIKCDETHPTCNNCRKSKRECLGYDPIFKQQQGQQQQDQQQQSQSTSSSSTPTAATAPSGPSSNIASSSVAVPSSSTKSEPPSNNSQGGYGNPTPPIISSSYMQHPTTSSASLDPTLVSRTPPLKHENSDYNTAIDPALQLTAGAATAAVESNSSSTPRPEQNHTSRTPHRDGSMLH